MREQDDDYKDEKWEKEFQQGLIEENGFAGEGLTPRQQRQNQNNQSYLNTYNAGEEWLMSEGGDDEFWKGVINNFRSAIGGSVEDLARLLADFMPNYKPAQTVLEKRTAGKIDDKAARQFENVKETTGAFGDKLVDYADIFSQNMGYNIFGFGAGNYLQGAGEGLDEYERLRNLGYSKEEALAKALGKGGYAIASTKVDDYVGKNGIVDIDLNLNNSSGIVITNKQFGKKIGKHTKEYNLNPGDANDRNEMEKIINNIVDNADEVVEGKWKGQNGPILFYRKGEDLVLVKKENNSFVSIFKGGANNGWFKDMRK